jgi:hypothetical protein
LSIIELSPVFTRELRRAVVVEKKKKVLAASKAKATSALALECLSGVGRGLCLPVTLRRFP